MSRNTSKKPDYPVRFKNDAGEEIPAFGLIQLEDGERPGLVLHASAPDDDGEDALFVNGATPVADGDPEGHCRSVHDGPSWVATDAVYSAGDVIGPIADSFEAGDAGGGFKVLFPHETQQAALCAVISSGDSFGVFQLSNDLEECGEPVPGYPLNDIECHTFEIGGDGSVLLCPSSGWKGVAFGGSQYQEASPDECDFGDIVLARNSGGRWYAVGAGYTSLAATANEDVDQGASGEFTVDVKIGNCNIIDGTVFPACEGDTREKLVTARSVCGDISAGDCAIVVWIGHEWVAVATSGGVEVDCGLIEEDGVISVDPGIAGDGLVWDGDTCTLNALAGGYDGFDPYCGGTVGSPGHICERVTRLQDDVYNIKYCGGEEHICDRLYDLEQGLYDQKYCGTEYNTCDRLYDAEKGMYDLKYCGGETALCDRLYDLENALYDMLACLEEVEVVTDVVCEAGSITVYKTCILACPCAEPPP